MTRALQRYNPQQAAALIPDTGISEPKHFSAALMRWSKANVNVLTPLQAIGELPEDYRVVAAAVVLDPDPDTGDDVYFSKIFHRQGECSLTKVGLDKLAAAAGISWNALQSGRTDDRKTEHVCSWRAVGSYLSPFGERLTLVGEVTLDLRKGSPYTRAWSDKQVVAAQAKLVERAESLAMNRAIRKLGLPGKMRQEQAGKPFITVRTIVQPADPNVRAQMLLAAQSGLAPAAPLPEIIEARPVPDEPPMDPDMSPPTNDPHDPHDEPPPPSDDDRLPDTDEIPWG